jgi:hypothetical protein
MVPLYLVRARKAAGRALPTLLYGYGGFDITPTPGWSPVRMAWLQAGAPLPWPTFAAAVNLARHGTMAGAWPPSRTASMISSRRVNT